MGILPELAPSDASAGPLQRGVQQLKGRCALTVCTRLTSWLQDLHL